MTSNSAAAPPFPHLRIPAGTSAFDRGACYGQFARQEILHSRTTYARLFAGCGIDWPTACARAETYGETIERIDATLLEEMRGIAVGADLALAEVLALNCRTELLPPDFFSGKTYDSAQALTVNRSVGIEDWLDTKSLDPAVADGECTSLGATGVATANGHTFIAQNWDWLGRQRQALVILSSHDSNGMPFTTLTEGGMLAKIGLNDAGLAVGLNILRSNHDGVTPGVPVHVLLRHLLSLQSLSDARDRIGNLAGSLGFGAASTVFLGAAGTSVAAFELAPRGWAELTPVNGVLAHSNHFVSDALREVQAAMAPALSSVPRLITANEHGAKAPLDKAAFERFLRDESDGFQSVCRRPDPAIDLGAQVESVAGVIIDCDARAFWICPGVPSQTEFVRVQ
jgi:isopenicillin-N N-acyltransferase-like protein